MASEKDHDLVVKQLLEKGADIAAFDVHGWSPLKWASMNGHNAVVKQLLGIGADTAKANKYIDFAK